MALQLGRQRFELGDDRRGAAVARAKLVDATEDLSDSVGALWFDAAAAVELIEVGARQR